MWKFEERRGRGEGERERERRGREGGGGGEASYSRHPIKEHLTKNSEKEKPQLFPN